MPSNTNSYLYKQLAHYMIQQISNGAYVAGARLPSVRTLCLERKISSNTVLNAYRLLESKGLVEARAQSGFFVSSEATEMQLTKRSGSTKNTGPILIKAAESHSNHPFGTAIISPELIPLRDITKIVKDVMNDRESFTRSLTYSEPKGIIELRGSIVRRYGIQGMAIHLDDVIITNGCLDALSLCLRAVTKLGDRVAIESPSYFGLSLLLKNLGLQAVEVSTDPKQGLVLSELEKHFKTGQIKTCVFSANFQNPLGYSMSNESKQRIVALGEQYGIPLIEDDIFGECQYGTKPTRSAKYFDKTGNVMLCSSFSKSVAPGFRLGWVVGGRFSERISELKSSTNLATSSLYQFVMHDYLDSLRFDKHIGELRHAIAQQTMRMRMAIKQYFPIGTTVTRPSGGFLLWVVMPIKYDAVLIQRQAANEGINFMQGTLFSPSGRYRNCMRFNCGFPWRNEFEIAFKRIAELIHNKKIVN